MWEDEAGKAAEPKGNRDLSGNVHGHHTVQPLGVGKVKARSRPGARFMESIADIDFRVSPG